MSLIYETELARLDITISDAELRIERQRQLIEKMRASDLPTEDACKTLEAMQSVLRTLQAYRTAILRLWKRQLH